MGQIRYVIRPTQSTATSDRTEQKGQGVERTCQSRPLLLGSNTESYNPHQQTQQQHNQAFWYIITPLSLSINGVTDGA
jgi:hypothetical protein